MSPKFKLNLVAEDIMQKQLQEEKDKEFSNVLTQIKDPSTWASKEVSKQNSIRMFD